MKKFSVGLIGFILGLTLATSAVALAASSIRVYVDGKEVVSDVPAQIIDGRTVLPVRAISEAMGASVIWDEVSNSVYITSKVYTPEPVVAPAPVVAPEIPVGVDVSPPVAPADTSVTSTVYGTPTWQEVARYESVVGADNGLGLGLHIKTPIFHISSNEWRVNWSTQAAKTPYSAISITAFNSVLSYEHQTVAAHGGTGSSYSTLSGAGDYYLDITGNQSYTITIEELK